ncbi:conserved oligomeric Golgi complex subunit 7 [Daphnia magna]|uniref:conserved oligomeric Golgi complex subunit 7 n=1 Tax=Daphnia magna TaxID=35525 RepID=UPI0014034F4E|nr:conserved oligomeric Golgi complex subunit 7 [Daphnia magna]
MDLSAFAKEQFCAKDWVNNTFRQSEAQSHESFASSIVMKLQLAIFEINNSLENTSTAVLSNLPRLLRDIELLQNEVVHFQRKLATVEHEVSKVENETTHSLEYIVKLDAVKSKLKATSKALQEADNWTTLMADIEELFESNDLMALSLRLSSLMQSLDLLNHVSDYGERMMQLDGLRNRLEALASPLVVSAISGGDAVKTAVMVQVFSNMDRLDQLLHYYTKCRRGVILHEWKELCELDDLNVVEVICRFHELLLADLQEQTTWYRGVFNQYPTGISRVILPIYSQAMSALDPNPLNSLESLIKKPAAAEALFMLQQIKSSADRLLQGVEAHFKDIGPIEEEVFRQFSDSLYQPFRLIISNKYKALCLQHLLEQFPEPINDSTEITESIQSLRQSHSKINSLMESTLQNCVTLTHGYGLELLIEAWNRFLAHHLQHYKSLLEKLQNLMDHSGEDSLHTALSLLQTLGELLLVLEENDSMFSDFVKTCGKKLNQEGVPLSCCKTFYLEPQPLQRLEALLKQCTQNKRFCYLSPTIVVALELNSNIQHSINVTLMSPIHQQINQLGSREWADIISGSGLTEDLPEFGLAPMEYITQIGQYLMMLPQHLEPFVLQENRGLTRALSEHSFPHGQLPDPDHPETGQHQSSATDFLLGCVATACASALSDAILRIESVGPKGAKQLAADIDYLGNIFEDLGLVLPASLMELAELFRAAAASILLSDVASFKSAICGKDHRLVAAVRSITNLPSSD